MIETKSYLSNNPGPKLLVFGAVHGDEKCGTEAIHQILPQFEFGEIRLTRGQVTFAPICNPEAYRRNVRYIDTNLNRNMVRTAYPDLYEPRLANQLIGLIENCDILLDIHSYHAGGPAFAIINEASPRYVDFAASLGTNLIISGWTQAYLASFPRNDKRSPYEHIGTTECAYNNGAIDVTLECGQHLDPKAPQVAYDGIIRALRHLNMIDKPHVSVAPKPRIATMSEVFYYDGGGQFDREWKHLDFIDAGTLIAKRKDGRPIIAEQAGVIILPRRSAPVGDEWFYLGYLAPA